MALSTSGYIRQEFHHADGSRDVIKLNLTGLSYVNEESSFDSAGVLRSVTGVRADGSIEMSYTVASNGEQTTSHYDAAGHVLNSTVQHMDGSSDSLVYQNGVLTSEIIKFNASSSDATEIKQFENGALTRDEITHKDHSRDVTIYKPGGVVELDHYDSAGTLRHVENHDLNGKISSSFDRTDAYYYAGDVKHDYYYDQYQEFYSDGRLKSISSSSIFGTYGKIITYEDLDSVHVVHSRSQSYDARNGSTTYYSEDYSYDDNFWSLPTYNQRSETIYSNGTKSVEKIFTYGHGYWDGYTTYEKDNYNSSNHLSSVELVDDAFGPWANRRLFLYEGNQTVHGDNSLYGLIAGSSLGGDNFDFRSFYEGNTRMTNFGDEGQATDKLVLDQFASFADLLAHCTIGNNGPDTVIHFSDTSSLTLVDRSLDYIRAHSDAFVFV